MGRGDGWRDVIRDAVTVKAAETASRNRAASDKIRISRVGFLPAFHVFLVRAAKRRGISVAGYIRRAVAALVAMDLELDVRDLIELDAAVTPIGKNGTRPTKDLDGALYGRWEVRPK